MYIRIIILCFFLVLFKKSFSQEFPKLRIDLSKAYGGAFSEYLDSIEYIPLETTKASLFGQISKLIITNNSFVISDEDTKCVLFFSTSGKFLKKVSNIGPLLASGAIYDAQKNKIEVAFENTNHSKLVINSYSVEGDFIKQGNETPIDVDFLQNNISIDENNYWLRNKILGFDSIASFHFFSQYKNGSKINSAIPFDNLNRYSLYRFTKEVGYIQLPIVYSNNFYFSTPIEHKLYKISTVDGTAEPVCQVVFPAKYGINNNLLAITNKKLVDSIVNTKWYAEKTILGLENIIYDKNRIIFKIKTGYFGYFASDGGITTRNFLYKFPQNLLVAFEKIHPDPSTYFLPFCDPKTISYEGFYFNKGYLFTHISSLRMFAANAAVKGKNPQYPSVLVNYFKSQNRKSNPVIVRMKLKD